MRKVVPDLRGLGLRRFAESAGYHDADRDAGVSERLQLGAQRQRLVDADRGPQVGEHVCQDAFELIKVRVLDFERGAILSGVLQTDAPGERRSLLVLPQRKALDPTTPRGQPVAGVGLQMRSGVHICPVTTKSSMAASALIPRHGKLHRIRAFPAVRAREFPTWKSLTTSDLPRRLSFATM